MWIGSAASSSGPGMVGGLGSGAPGGTPGARWRHPKEMGALEL